MSRVCCPDTPDRLSEMVGTHSIRPPSNHRLHDYGTERTAISGLLFAAGVFEPVKNRVNPSTKQLVPAGAAITVDGAHLTDDVMYGAWP